MIWDEPWLFVFGLFAYCALGTLLPIRVENREDHIILTVTASVAGGILGPPALVLVWAGIAVGAPLVLLWSALPRNRTTLGVPAGLRSVAWMLVSGVALTVGFLSAYLVYTTILGRPYPVQLATTQDVMAGGLMVTVGWAATMAVRILTVRLITGSLMPHGLDPFDSVLIPYLLPLIGGFPLVTACVAMYHPGDPWPSLIMLWWVIPLYLATAYDLRRRRLAQELRRDAFAKQRLAAIGEVSARIVHQSRHQVGLMGWSIHRLRNQVGSSTPEALAAVEQELDALAQAKDRLSQMLASELLHERATESRDARDADGPERDARREPDGLAGSGHRDTAAEEPGDHGEPAGDDARSPGADAALTFGDLVHEVVEQLRHEAEREGVALSVTLDAALAASPGPRQLRDVVFNLVDNAIDAAQGTVVVELQAVDDTAAICVRDDGPGLASSDDADRIFEPFFTTKSDGTGMGLAIADAVVGDLGGDLRYERADGWTSFVVVLSPPPATARPTTARPPGRDASRSGARR